MSTEETKAVLDRHMAALGAADLAATMAVTPTGEQVEREVAYVTWTSDGVPFGTDTFVVRDGKIAVQTAAMFLG